MYLEPDLPTQKTLMKKDYRFPRENTLPITKTSASAPAERVQGRGDFAVVGTGVAMTVRSFEGIIAVVVTGLTTTVKSFGGRSVGSKAFARANAVFASSVLPICRSASPLLYQAMECVVVRLPSDANAASAAMSA